MTPIISAIFSSHADAGNAVSKLRSMDVPDQAISVLTREHPDPDAQDDRPDNRTSGTLKGLGVGAGVGALFGLTALVIPGVGPFIAAGSLLPSLGVVGSAAASGAVVGGTAGTLSGALIDYGVNEQAAHDYEREIQAGGIWIGVDARLISSDPASIEAVLKKQGGRIVEGYRSEMA